MTKPLIVIIGPTASGKTALGVRLAQQYSGEIVSADSRTVFRGMDVGTAKPDMGERGGVPHWGLDLVDPGERYTAAAWQSYAQDQIADIRDRGKLPIVVGGTGLYVDGLIFDYQYPDEPSDQQRQHLEGMGRDELVRYCTDNNIELPENDKNRRHLMRAIVHAGQLDKRRDKIIDNTYVVGIATDRLELRNRIARRTEQMFTDGVVDEARMLGEKYGWDNEALTDNIYPLLREHIDGKIPIDQAMEAFRHRDWQLAKRQLTWFRRNPYIAWGTTGDTEHYITSLLAD